MFSYESYIRYSETKPTVRKFRKFVSKSQIVLSSCRNQDHVSVTGLARLLIEHIEIFTKEIGLRPSLGNQAPPVMELPN